MLPYISIVDGLIYAYMEGRYFYKVPKCTLVAPLCHLTSLWSQVNPVGLAKWRENTLKDILFIFQDIRYIFGEKIFKEIYFTEVLSPLLFQKNCGFEMNWIF